MPKTSGLATSAGWAGRLFVPCERLGWEYGSGAWPPHRLYPQAAQYPAPKPSHG